MPQFATKMIAIRPVLETGVGCERCGSPVRLVNFVVVKGEQDDCPGCSTAMPLCAECLAEALEVATGYKVRNQIHSWDVVRARWAPVKE